MSELPGLTFLGTLSATSLKRGILNTCHGRDSYELGIEFQRRNTIKEVFNLYDMLKRDETAGKVDESPIGGCQASSREAHQR